MTLIIVIILGLLITSKHVKIIQRNLTNILVTRKFWRRMTSISNIFEKNIHIISITIN